MSSKKPAKKTRKLSVYSNLTQKRKVKKDSNSRKRAEYLATLPKHPVKRFLYCIHPKRFWKYWLSKEGGIMALKIAGVGVLLLALFIGGMFAYFRKDLDQIRPGEIDKRVQTTVTTYTDRNGEVLWEDKGGDNYKLVVKSEDLSDNLKKATVAIEDKDFFKHSGVSFSATLRAAINNFSGGSTQGGSTLTQQLVKQVFFSEEASDRSLGGIPRKIKELILSIEIERMYDKDQILTLYLNESPYGGRRNGAESGAQSYFGKSAKDLTVAEAALLAAIPNNPTYFNPYRVGSHDVLIARQHQVLKDMLSVGYINQKEYDEAINVPILDQIKSEADGTEGMKAPHFVLMVRSQLEQELGKATVGKGGLTIKTTLDKRIQDKTEEAVAAMFASSTPGWAGFTNGAATVQDNETGQIIALVGSRDFNYEGFGQDNAATAYIQPGSAIKPLVFSQLFQQKPEGQQNYGSGSILVDERIDDIYKSQLQNADRKYLGSVTIRQSLATSRNVPAVKAMYINEQAKPGSTLKTIRDLGAKSYCSQGADKTVNLALAIGGCGVTQVDLVNAFSTLARNGSYKPQSSVLEVKNSSGETLKKWTPTDGKQVIDPQAAYVVTDILGDARASASLGNYAAKNIPGVRLAVKTGTSDKGGYAKDLWMAAYSPSLSMAVWLGNPDTTILKNGTSSLGSPIIASVMEYAHKEVYAAEGKWKSGDWFTQPSGIQRMNQSGSSQVYPSWWSNKQGITNDKLTFDRVSKKKATECTPAGARIEVDVLKVVDPVTKKDSYSNVPDGYNWREEDDAHACGDAKPSINTINVNGPTGSWTISASISKGKFGVGNSNVVITVDGARLSVSGSGSTYTATYSGDSDPTGRISVTVTDEGYYTDTKSK